MVIRAEEDKDVAAITEVTIAAFKNHPVSRQTEHFIVIALRKSEALTISLVAEEEGGVVSHIAFSPVEVEDGTSRWYGLGPVSVLPEQRHEGLDGEILNNRRKVYEKAREKHPERWSGETRNWDRTEEVYLNPEEQENFVTSKRHMHKKAG